MIMYELKVTVDQQWLDILDQITKHQEGFLWEDIEAVTYIEVE